MGSPRTLINEVIFTVGANEQDVSDTTLDGTEFDRLNTDNAVHDLVVLVDVGLWTTDGTFTVRIEESDTSGSGFTAVAAADVLVGSGTAAAALGESAGTVIIDSAADDNQQIVLGYFGSKRFVRGSVVVTTQTTGQVADVVIWYVGSNPRNMVRTT